MATSGARRVFCSSYLAILAVLLFGCCTASAQDKKATAPAKPAPKTTTAPKVASGGSGTKSTGATTTNTSHPGTTTASASQGVTTETAGHGGATTTSGKITTSSPHPTERTTTAGSARPATSHSTPATTGQKINKPTTMASLPKGSTMHAAPNGNQIRTRSNGKPADVHVANRNMDIHHTLNGKTQVVTTRPDGSRIVSERGGRAGYVQHAYAYQGHEFAQRTYVYNGVVYNRYYGGYAYRGAYVNYYAPAYYYSPAYYGWAYNSWASPIAYSWGWAGNPWYGYYGYYFTPYPVYASPSLWLTDYMISATLAAAYQAQANAAAQAQAADAAALTQQTKDLIAEEVRYQIELENAEAQSAQNGAPDPASSSIQRLLNDNRQHVFVAGKSIDVVDAAGNECAISEGDALQLSGSNADAANLLVLSSKGGPECQKGDTVAVTFPDLQEMQNHMRETIDQGMGELKKKQGQSGMPALPASASGEPVKANFASAAPPPDQNAATEISQQSQAADQAEKEALNQPQDSGSAQVASATAPAPLSAPAAPPTEISMGQSIDAVTAALGQPKDIVDLGAKKIYIFKDMKVTFKDGKVSDVQ